MSAFNETAIEHIAGEELCGISTGERTMRNRLAKLAEQNPEQVKCIALNEDGSVYYKVPWRWVTVRKPSTRTMTAEQRAELAERMKDIRARIGSNNYFQRN